MVRLTNIRKWPKKKTLESTILSIESTSGTTSRDQGKVQTIKRNVDLMSTELGESPTRESRMLLILTSPQSVDEEVMEELTYTRCW